MTSFLNSWNTVVSAGLGGLAFLGTWTYLVLRWLETMDLGIGGGLSFGTQTITIPWLW